MPVTLTFADTSSTVHAPNGTVVCARCGNKPAGTPLKSCCKLAEDLTPGDQYRFDNGQIRLIDTVEVV